MSFFQGARIDHFEHRYRVFTGAFCSKSGLDDGGKVILPASALDELVRLNIVYPMLFKIENKLQGTSTHCGVLEFIAEEGRVYIPFWMQEHLQLSPGQFVTITNTSLPKGSFCKIRPQQKAFIDLTDPRAVLEKRLRDFSCLTKGDTIMINYNNTNFGIDILEVASAKGACEAISIVEADVRVEFERPLDMPPSPLFKAPSPEQMFNQEVIPRGVPATGPATPIPEDNFQAFKGEGRRLDGRPIRGVAPKPSLMASAYAASSSSSALHATSPPQSASATSTPMVPVFGKKRRKYGDTAAATNGSGPAPANPSPSAESKDDLSGFKAFQGAGRTLK